MPRKIKDRLLTAAHPLRSLFLPVMALPRHFRQCFGFVEMPTTRWIVLQRRRCCNTGNGNDGMRRARRTRGSARGWRKGKRGEEGGRDGRLPRMSVNPLRLIKVRPALLRKGEDSPHPTRIRFLQPLQPSVSRSPAASTSPRNYPSVFSSLFTQNVRRKCGLSPGPRFPTLPVAPTLLVSRWTEN